MYICEWKARKETKIRLRGVRGENTHARRREGGKGEHQARRKLWEVFTNGTEILRARFSTIQNKFIPIP